MPHYAKPNPNEPNIHRLTDAPDLKAQIGEMQDAINGAFDYYDRNEHALNVRESWWEGQTRDGRKHGTDTAAAFPWENASDTRIRTADMIIRERVMLKMAAVARMNVQIVSPQAKDIDFAGRMAALLRWYLHNECADEAFSELELLLNYEETFGAAVLGVGWWQTMTYETKKITIDDIAQLAVQKGGPALLADVGQMLFDPLLEDTTIDWLRALTPLLTVREARRVLNDWRENAEAEVDIPILDENRPQLTALQVMQDVIFPVNTWRLQRSRWIAQRELLTEPELREKADGREGWDPDFVEAVLQKPGQTFNSNLGALALLERQRELGGAWGWQADEADQLFEVWHFITRVNHRGTTALYRTVLHPGCADYYGLHEMQDYAHGQYPFVEFVREHRARSILASRGWPELLDTPQSEIKVQRDSRIDRASVTTLPPIVRKERTGGQQDTFGPGVVWSGKKGDVEVFDFGRPDPTSIEVERATMHAINEYAGRRGEGIAPELVGLHEQDAVSRFLLRMQIAGTQMLQLAQQFTAPMTIGQVTGLIPKPYEITRDAIAGNFRLLLNFDPRFTNTEWVFGVLERLEKYVIPLDTNAVVNRDAVIRWAMAGIDPTLADLAVRPSETAAQSEVEDEIKNVALLVSGIAPPMKLQGQNHAARLNVLQQVFQQNSPFYTALLQTRPDFAQNVQARLDFLTQQVQQQKNKQIGIYGAMPSASSPGMASMGGMGAAAGPQMGSFATAGGAA